VLLLDDQGRPMIGAGIDLELDVVLNLIGMKWLVVARIALSTSLFYSDHSLLA